MVADSWDAIRTPPLTVLTLALLSWLGGALEAACSDARLLVAVSVAPHGWLVERVAGPGVEVLLLVGAGESPATYQPTDAQVTRLMASAIYFRTGVPFERGAWFQAIGRSRELEVVDLREGLELRAMEPTHEHGENSRLRSVDRSTGDPHVWLSPRLLRIQARTVARHLTRKSPARRRAFAANLQDLLDDLDRLDRSIRSRLEPFRGRAFFVFHPAWGYFAHDYGLRQIAIEIEGKSPTDHELTRLERTARQERAKVVYVQPQIRGRAAGAVARAVGARLEVLDPLAADVVANLDGVASRLRESFE